MGKHVKGYDSSNKSSSNLCKDVFCLKFWILSLNIGAFLVRLLLSAMLQTLSSICVGLQSLFSCFEVSFFAKTSSLKLNINCFLTVSLW